MKATKLKNIAELKGEAYIFNSVKYINDESFVKHICELFISAGFAREFPTAVYEYDGKTLFHFEDISPLNLPRWHTFTTEFCDANFSVNGVHFSIGRSKFSTLTQLKKVDNS